jgi:DNA-binding NtrC family response regulator
VQGKLLRVIEEKAVDRIGGRGPVPVDVRIVAATNKDLRGAVDKGEFRGDLFFRLAVFPIDIPPLRERGDDVILLGRHFAAQIGNELHGRESTLSHDSVSALRAHRWPGNVRELENSIERACILADSAILEPLDLGFGPDEAQDPRSFGFDTSGTLGQAAERAVALVERRKIADALAENDGNKTRAAETLGVSYKTLLTKVKDYSL